ncbi:MAG TPA: hypothetical protein VES01_04435 [Dermatophilaceae bacterium]|nr:hypothetical protein [Dermatophilaceae bacterium]
MRTSIARAVAGLLGAGAMVLPAQLPAQSAMSAVPPEVTGVTSIARYLTPSRMSVTVTYQCQNTRGRSGVDHYLTARLAQPGTTSYTLGVASLTPGGIVRATCLNKRVSQVITLHRSAAGATAIDPAPGRADVTVTLERRATRPGGGWRRVLVPSVTYRQSVVVACNGTYARGRCLPPAQVPTRVYPLPRTIVYTSATTMAARVAYTCQNLPGPVGLVHYLGLTYRQGQTAYYGLGWRNDGGLQAATCTGRPTTQWVTLHRSLNTIPGTPDPRPGRAGSLSLSVMARSTYDVGGWYVIVAPDVTTARTVALACNRRYLGAKAPMPVQCRVR